MLHNANTTSPDVSALLHSGNIITSPIREIQISENICSDRVSNVLKFGYIGIDEDLLVGPYSNKVQPGNYILVYRPSDFTEFLFRVRSTETRSPGSYIHLTETPEGLLKDLVVGDVVVIGLVLEDSSGTDCSTPEPLRTIHLRSTSARIEFSRILDVDVYRVRYKSRASNIWHEVDITGGRYYADITGLVSNTIYEWQVMGFFGYPNTFSEYSKSLMFTTR